ncbi:MAG: arsenate reductase ArsC [Candidatus Marinimicrobia bacterium]|nr:arsenate reductase ArsC [Candidatus Neomarinimicrobiota bacterium]
MRILILCTGNSCRSQMAHGFMKHFDKRLEVFSAGVSPLHGSLPHSVEVMAEKGIDISDHVPEDVRDYTDRSFDYVITVCDLANEVCPHFSGKVKHRLHFSFPDPYRTPGGHEAVMKAYRKVRDNIETTFYQLYRKEMEPLL